MDTLVSAYGSNGKTDAKRGIVAVHTKGFYTDPDTGVRVTQHTQGAFRSAKLYCSAENFSQDDKSFFPRRNPANDAGVPSGGCRCSAQNVAYRCVLGLWRQGLALRRHGHYSLVIGQSRIHPEIGIAQIVAVDLRQMKLFSAIQKAAKQ